MSAKEKLSAAYDRLQSVSITATRNNLEAMLQSLYDLQNAYIEISGGAEDGSEDKRPPDNPEG